MPLWMIKVITRPDLSEIFDDSSKAIISNIDLNTHRKKNSPLPLLGCIPWNFDLIATRATDMAKHLKCDYRQ